MTNPFRNILLVNDLSLASGRSFFVGLSRYINEKGHWRLTVVQNARELPTCLESKQASMPDGIITTDIEEASLADWLDAQKIPTVIVGDHSRPLPTRKHRIVYMSIDESKVGCFAAESLASLGRFNSYGIVPSTQADHKHWSDQRCVGFCQRIQQAGHHVVTYGGLPDASDSLADWLLALPKPTAIFAVYDHLAQKVIESCRLHQLNVPNQVAVLGVDNDNTAYLSCIPRLSSVDLDTEEVGYGAAAALDRLLRMRKPSIKATHLIAKTNCRLVERESIRYVNPAAHLISSAQSFIVAHANQRLSVPDVVRHLKVSRRLAELRFREVLGKSIGETIREVRLKHLIKELKNSSAPAARICRACGFSNVSSAATSFRRVFGKTMGAFRVSLSHGVSSH